MSKDTIWILGVIISFIIVVKLIDNYFDRKRKQRVQKQRQNYIEQHGEEYGTMIANKRIGVGMTLEMVKQSWGEPLKVADKVFRQDYEKANYYFGKFKDKAGYKYRVTIVNELVTEMRED